MRGVWSDSDFSFRGDRYYFQSYPGLPFPIGVPEVDTDSVKDALSQPISRASTAESTRPAARAYRLQKNRAA